MRAPARLTRQLLHCCCGDVTLNIFHKPTGAAAETVGDIHYEDSRNSILLLDLFALRLWSPAPHSSIVLVLLHRGPKMHRHFCFEVHSLLCPRGSFVLSSHFSVFPGASFLVCAHVWVGWGGDRRHIPTVHMFFSCPPECVPWVGCFKLGV